MINQYHNCHTSMFAFCKSFAASQSGVSDLEVFDFDAHASIDELPEKDIVGVSEFELDVDENVFEITCLVGVSTLHDGNLWRLNELINALFDKLQPSKHIPYIDYQTGNQAGLMTVMNGTRVMPIVRTKIRPVKFVAVRIGSDQTGP